MTASALLGTAFRRGLPPGVYEHRPSVARQPEVRLDVAAFVGLTERGPLDRAVALESFDAYRTFFGAPGGGRLLGQSVYLFFANGGRRCVVVRGAGPEARPAAWDVPWISAAGSNLRLMARDPGAWGNRLRGRFRFVLRSTPATPHIWPEVFLPDLNVELGATVRLVLASAGVPPQEHFGEVTAIRTNSGGKRIVTLSGVPEPPAAELARRLTTLQEIRLEIELATADTRERFTELGLTKAHSRYALDVLRGDPLRPPVGTGSMLIVPADAPERLRPAGDLLLRGDYEQIWQPEHLITPGDDDAVNTDRRDFFEHLDGNSPLDLLDAYDELNETQPVGCVCMPDLVHPRQVDAIELREPPVVATDPLRFGECVRPEPIEADVPVALYPRLALSFDLLTGTVSGQSALGWQAELVARCEIGGRSVNTASAAEWGRIAILDLPPGLTATDVLRWRRTVASERGAGALYAPYLRSAPAEAPLAPLLVVPPCGAAAGIIARRERARGVHAAPANEIVQGVAGLFAGGHLPDAGFFHEARVNLVRTTERGATLLGSRTTSDDGEWTHLSVRRLVYWLERQLALDTRWAVFEPNDRILWSRVARGVEQRLAALLAAGALAGASPQEAFFVRCTGTEGRLLVKVGVAPSAPAEFIVFELVQLVDGSSSLEERNG